MLTSSASFRNRARRRFSLTAGVSRTQEVVGAVFDAIFEDQQWFVPQVERVEWSQSYWAVL